MHCIVEINYTNLTLSVRLPIVSALITPNHYAFYSAQPHLHVYTLARQTKTFDKKTDQIFKLLVQT